MLKNMTELMVQEKLNELLENGESCCNCSQCREDIIAYALNQLSPHYVSTDEGHLYTKAKVLSIQYEVEITTALAKAIKQVSEHPRHL